MDNQLTIVEDSPASLISVAIKNGASIEQLEKLLALKERYDAAQANKSFLAAMSKFQKEVPEIQKKKSVAYPSRNGGGNVSYKYAELGEIDATIKSAMADNGLSKRWEVYEDGEKLICTCIVSHVDGHTERTTMSSAKDASGGKNEIQSRASAISYLQRYTLIGALGLTTASEDNDGDGTAPAVQQQSAPQNDLPWLNITDRQGNKTSFGDKICHDIANGLTTIEKLKQQYKISKPTMDELSKTKVVASPISSPDPSAPPLTDADTKYRTATNDVDLICELIDHAKDAQLLKVFRTVNYKMFKSNPELEERLIKKGLQLSNNNKAA